MRIVNAMMKRLNIMSFWQFTLIMVVFAITGSLSLYITVEFFEIIGLKEENFNPCLLYTSPSPRDRQKSRMPSSA